MREIEFRGKVRECNEWVYGSLVYIPFDDGSEYCCIMENNCDDECLPYINNDSGAFDWYMIPVDKETIGQYTGLCDKNGTKIFEGDILEFCFDGIGNQKAIIIYNNTYASFMLKPLANFCFTTMSDGVVVGNIHDNLELLEVSDDN